MSRNTKLLFYTLLMALVAMSSAAGALAGNAQDSRIDAIASSIAGHPVNVWCETDDVQWVGIESQFPPGFEADGFTFIDTPTVYLAPRICLNLHLMLDNGYAAAGPAWGALAIKVLIHEDVHQRGISDEAVTDCTALSEFQADAVKFFGVPATVSQTYAVGRYVLVKVGPKTRRVRTKALVTQQVPNPALAELYAWAVAWHKAMPAAYQGTC